jgi:hypothetical protein
MNNDSLNAARGIVAGLVFGINTLLIFRYVRKGDNDKQSIF